MWGFFCFFCLFVFCLYRVFVAARGLSLVAASGGYSSLRCTGFSLRWLSCCKAWALGTRASVVVACGLSSCGSRALEHRLRSCGARAQLLRSMWDLPGPGLEPVSPALAGRFLTTAPPGKPRFMFLTRLGSPDRPEQSLQGQIIKALISSTVLCSSNIPE